MKHASLILATIASFFAFAGCAHPQPSPTPVTQASVQSTWSLAPGAQASWITTLYQATVASLTSSCPVPGGSTYSAVGTTAGNVGSFIDSNETPGAYICQLTQNSTTSGCGATGTSPCYSAYSPVSAVCAVPVSPIPTAPGTPVPVNIALLLAPEKREGPHTPTVSANAPPAPNAPHIRVVTRTGI